MPFFRVFYQSMTATYGPCVIEAETASDAKKKFGRGCFTPGEQAFCMTARKATIEEIAAEEDRKHGREIET